MDKKPITERCRLVYYSMPNSKPLRTFITTTEELTGHSKKSIHKSFRSLEDNGWVWIEKYDNDHVQMIKRKSLSGIQADDDAVVVEYMEINSERFQNITRKRDWPEEVDPFFDYPSQKIKRFKLREGITEKELKAAGFRECEWNGEKYYYFHCPLEKPVYGWDVITINIHIYLDRTWDDIEHIDVLDENYCQPFTPFYSQLESQMKDKSLNQWSKLKEIIFNYNRVMSKFPLFEEVK